MSDQILLGIDGGRSAVKATARQGGRTFTTIFPTAVVKAKAMVFDQLREAAAADTISLDGEDYWTGQTAMLQSIGTDPVGRNDEWIVTPQHDALVLSAIKRMTRDGLVFGNPEDVYLTLGVPSNVFKGRGELLESVKARMKKCLGDVHVSIFPQPFGVIAAHSLQENGSDKPNKNIMNESYGVIDIGQHTTDFSAVVRGQPIVNATISVEGVDIIAEQVRLHMRSIDSTIEVPSIDLQSLVKEPVIRIRGTDYNVKAVIDKAVNEILLPKVIGAAREAFSTQMLQQFDAVLIAGGGAPVLYNGIRNVKAFSHALLLNNPREAVADGFARLSGLSQLTAAA